MYLFECIEFWGPPTTNNNAGANDMVHVHWTDYDFAAICWLKFGKQPNGTTRAGTNEKRYSPVLWRDSLGSGCRFITKFQWYNTKGKNSFKSLLPNIFNLLLKGFSGQDKEHFCYSKPNPRSGKIWREIIIIIGKLITRKPSSDTSFQFFVES